MTPEQMGKVFAYLFAYRVAETFPMDRRRHPDEQDVVGILTANELDLHDFEAFLEAQGFTLYAIDIRHFGRAADGRIFVLARRGDMPKAPYLDTSWLWHALADGRRTSETQTSLIVWAAQLWAMMNWFFYTRIGRTPEQVSRYREALVSVTELTRAVEQHVEALRNAGRPEGTAGAIWDIVTGATSAEIAARVRRFVTCMVDCKALARSDGSDERFVQSIVAAVEMKLNFDRSAGHLMPPAVPGDGAVELLQGYREDGHVGH